MPRSRKQFVGLTGGSPANRTHRVEDHESPLLELYKRQRDAIANLKTTREELAQINAAIRAERKRRERR